MPGVLILAGLAMALAPAAPEPVAVGLAINPKAVELFDSDWVIKDWGLRFFDRDRNATLSPAEATVGAQAFRELADGDNDGKVTPHEFRRAREYLLARY